MFIALSSSTEVKMLKVIPQLGKTVLYVKLFDVEGMVDPYYLRYLPI